MTGTKTIHEPSQIYLGSWIAARAFDTGWTEWFRFTELGEALRPGGVLDKAIRDARTRRPSAAPTDGSAPPAKRPACARDDQCKGNRICVAGECRDGCTSDAICKGERICQQGRCQPGCRTDDQCAANRICQQGRCEPGCRTDDQCKGNRICRLGQCEAGCADDTQCLVGQRCNQGRCVDEGGAK